MSKQVGYLINYPSGLAGERGIYFDYILAANGLFIEASKPSLSARIPVETCEVRGLAPIKPKITLTYGSIPGHFFDLALDIFLASPDTESYVGVTANAGYHLYLPDQQREEAKVVYNIGDSVVLDIHSHARMPAFFSVSQDDKDETGLKLYAVVGRLDKVPMVLLRVGVYGYFYSLGWKDIFDGTLTGAVECDEYEKEVIENELHGSVGRDVSGNEVHNSRLWWNRWFRS